MNENHVNGGTDDYEAPGYAGSPLLDAVERIANHNGGPERTYRIDLDRSTVVPGSPGIFDGLVITEWLPAKPEADGVGEVSSPSRER